MSAADQLKESVKSQVREIVEGAEARAAEIEEEARRKVAALEAASERRYEQLLQSAIEQTTQMLNVIEAAERNWGGATHLLRSETQKLASELKAAREKVGPSEPALRVEPPELREQQQQEPAAKARRANASRREPGAPADAMPPSPEPTLKVEPPELKEQPPTREKSEAPPGFEVREMVRTQIVSMFHSGKPRAEAERFLMRFKQGENYVDLLDEVYTRVEQPKLTGGRRRRRGLRRR